MNKEEISKRIDEGLQILKQEPSFIFHPEEIKAIEHFKNYPKNWDLVYEINKKAIEIVLNLISKLRKQNEELKDDKEGLINGYKDTADKLEELRAKYNELQKENKKLKLDNQILKETLYGGNVSE